MKIKPDPIQVGLQLQKARNLRNLNLKEVAQALELASNTLIRMEQGFEEYLDSVFVLEGLAKIYQCQTSFFFSKENNFPINDLASIVNIEIQEFPHDLETRLLIWQTLLLCKTGLWLEEDLEIEPERKLPYFEDFENSVEAAEFVATSIAQSFSGEPLNSNEIIQKYQTWVPECRLPEGIEALIVQHPDIMNAVLVNQDLSIREKQKLHLQGFALCFGNYEEKVVQIIPKENANPDLLQTHAKVFANKFMQLGFSPNPIEFKHKMVGLIKQAYYNKDINRGISRGKAIEIGRDLGFSREEIEELTFPNL